MLHADIVLIHTLIVFLLYNYIGFLSIMLYWLIRWSKSVEGEWFFFNFSWGDLILLIVFLLLVTGNDFCYFDRVKYIPVWVIGMMKLFGVILPTMGISHRPSLVFWYPFNRTLLSLKTLSFFLSKTTLQSSLHN